MSALVDQSTMHIDRRNRIILGDARPIFPAPFGLECQAADLDLWRMKLTAECFLAVLAEANRRNAEIDHEGSHAGYSVWRGCQISEYIANWRPPMRL